MDSVKTRTATCSKQASEVCTLRNGVLSTTLLLKDGQDVFESDVDTVNTQDAEQFAAGAAFLHRWFILGNSAQLPIAVRTAYLSPCRYFGQPSTGFFLDRDFFTRSLQLPFSFSRSALGPGVAFFLEWFELFTAFFLFTSLNILSLGKWVFVHQSLSFGCFHGKNGALAIVQRPIVPEKIDQSALEPCRAVR